MFKKTMKFDDLDGNEVTQTFYFNYNKKEIAELLEFGAVQQFAEPGVVHTPLEEMMEKLSTPREEQGLSQQENNQQAYNIFQALILDAYGEKGEDNVTFKKSWDLRKYFESHVAFVELIFEFLGNEKLAAEFMENCLPPRLVARAKEEMEAEKANRKSDSTIAEMVSEAAERQKDPATRIEPGLEAAREAGVAPQESDIVTVTEGMTDDEILAAKPQDLSKAQLLRGFELKNAKNQNQG